MTFVAPIKSDDRLRTAPGGDLANYCDDHIRTLIAIYSSGRMVMTKDALEDQSVSHLLSLVDRLGGPPLSAPEYAETGAIRGLYSDYMRKAQLRVVAAIDEQSEETKITFRRHAFNLLQTALGMGSVSDVVVRYDRYRARPYALVDGDMVPIGSGDWEASFTKQLIAAYQSWAGVHGSAERSQVVGAHQVGQISSGLPDGIESVRLQKIGIGFTGEELVMRIMPTPKEGGITFRGCGFDDEQIRKFDEMISKPNGMVIVTGPTGGGKTTTLHAMLGRSLEIFPGDRWLTIEDPIEIRVTHENVTQIDVVRAAHDGDIPRAYQEALEVALRAAPRRILAGEIRSRMVAGTVVTAALSGHQVLTTAHTESVFTVVPRLIDLGISPTLLRSEGVLKGITSQRLLRSLCKECAQLVSRDRWNGYLPSWLKVFLDQGMPIKTAFPQGCKCCRKGYKIGRTVLTELMVPHREIIVALIDGDTKTAEGIWHESGGLSMAEQAKAMVGAGLFDPYEVFRCVDL